MNSYIDPNMTKTGVGPSGRYSARRRPRPRFIHRLVMDRPNVRYVDKGTGE